MVKRLVLKTLLWAVRLPVLDPVPDMPWPCLWSSSICSLATSIEPGWVNIPAGSLTFLKGTNLPDSCAQQVKLYTLCLASLKACQKDFANFFLFPLLYSSCAPARLDWIFPAYTTPLTWPELFCHPFLYKHPFSLCPSQLQTCFKKPFLITLTQWPISSWSPTRPIVCPTHFALDNLFELN